MARGQLTVGALLVRVTGVGATALGLGVLCGVALVGDPPPGAPGPALADTAGPARAPARRRHAPEPAPVVSAALPAPPAVEEAAPVDPLDLVRELPDAHVVARLASLLAGPDTDVAVQVAQALAVAPSSEGRALLVAHLCRSVDDAPELSDLACLEALAEIGQVPDLDAVLPWARRADSAGVLAAWCVRAICARERVEPPEELREVPTPAEPRG